MKVLSLGDSIYERCRTAEVKADNSIQCCLAGWLVSVLCYQPAGRGRGAAPFFVHMGLERTCITLDNIQHHLKVLSNEMEIYPGVCIVHSIDRSSLKSEA